MAKKTLKGITTPKGFRAAGITCGIKESGKPDLALILADTPCAAAGVFTTNRMPSAAVTVGRRHLRSGTAQAIVCNSGIANSATGDGGLADALTMCKWVARTVPGVKIKPQWVLPSSTGVIGPRLPMEKIEQGIEKLTSQLSRGSTANATTAEAIMTTDLVPKQAYRSIRLGARRNRTIHIGGVCKGSGMIAPNMATMLVFVTTDVNISHRMLQTALSQAASETFNRISVDQHTSPSDSLLILASGAAGGSKIERANRDYRRFQEALTNVCEELAYQIVSDGEGVTRVMRVRVMDAANTTDADRAAKAIVDSPLVKTAIHGSDPNWGRILTAVGYSGAKIKPQIMTLHLGAGKNKGKPVRRLGICVFDQGEPTKLTVKDQKQLQQIMANEEVVITVHLGAGRANTQWLGCDLSREYVTINADYTT